MKPLLVVILSTALVPLLSVPAFAQTATDDQYNDPRHDDPTTSIGHEAADDALEASEAFDSGPEGSASGSEAIASEVGESADGSASESGDSATSESDAGEPEVDSAEGGTAEDEDGSSGDSVAATGSSEAAAELPEDPAELGTITRLPKTGGLSPLSLGVVLVVGGLLVRGVARRALGC